MNDTNFDETVLISQRVDPSFDEPIINQVLRIAMYDEFGAYETYKKVLERFGEVTPFVNIANSELRHIAALESLFVKYGVDIPINDLESKIIIPSTLAENYEVGVAAEIDNINMYSDLLRYVEGYDDIKEVLYRLQAASYNNHLPAFRQHVARSSFSPDIAASEDIKNIGEKLVKGEVSQEEILKMISNTNLSFLGGVLLGGVAAAVAVNMMDKKDE